MNSKLLFLLLFTAVQHIAFSQNWTGALNSDWNNSANWSTTPGNGDDITIDPTFYTGANASPIIATNSTFSPAAIAITNGGNLTISANLTTSDDVEAIGIGSNISVTNGIFNVNVNDGGRLILDLGATMTINGGTTNVGERFISGIDALVTINSGTATSGERLLMDGGGRFIQNGGAVSVAATFAMADGSANYNSSYVLNNGTLTVAGEFGFENEAGNFEPSFTQNGGIFTLNGDMFWFGEVPGSGTPKCFFNDGYAFINGFIENMPLSTVNMYIKLDNEANVTFDGNRWESISPLDSVIITGNSILKLRNTHNIINTGVWYASGNASTLFQGTTNLTGAGSYQFHDVFINGSTLPNSLNHATTSSLNISGDFFALNNFVANNNQVVFNGNESQSITSYVPLQFFNLEINNSSTGLGITSGTTTIYSIAGHLQLTNGVLTVSATETLRLLDNATASSGYTTSFVNGALTKIGDDAFVFPVGKNNRWRRLGISAPSTITSEFRAEYFNSTYPTITPVNSPLSSVTNAEYWQLDQLNGSNSVNVSLFWEDASQSYITDCGELSMAHWNGTSWDNILTTSSGSCTAQDAGSITSTGISSNFGAFTFGFYSGVTTQNFTVCQGETIIVGSNTYSTTGNYFDVLEDQLGADSIVITNLTVNNPIATISTFNASMGIPFNSNQTYQWINCDGTVIPTAINNQFTPTVSGNYAIIVTEGACADTSNCVFYTIVDTTICNGSSYQVGTSIYTSADTYVNVLSATNTNDSIVVSNVAVNSPSVSASVASITITALATGATYQWLNCNDFSVIPNETNQTFTPTSNGNYAVEITENGCVDTSSCVTINSVGISEVLLNEAIKVYPNPFQNSIHIEANGVEMEKIVVSNFLGQIITEQIVNGTKLELTTSHFNPGIYFIAIHSQYGTQLIKTMKH